MFDENFSTSGTCSGNYCPAPLKELNELFGLDDELQPSDEDCLSVSNAIATVEFELRTQSTQLDSHNATAKPLQAQTSPKTIPLCIALGANLTDPAEKACADAVAGHLSSECDRVVAVSELEGLLLFLWSEHDIKGVPISEYLSESRPLQGLVVHPRDRLSQVGAEVRRFLGKSFEFVAV